MKGLRTPPRRTGNRKCASAKSPWERLTPAKAGGESILMPEIGSSGHLKAKKEFDSVPRCAYNVITEGEKDL